MSASTASADSLTPGKEPTAAHSGGASDHKDGLREKHAHAGVAMAIATLAMAASSGIQALLYLSSFGVGGKTDGFFVAFALYSSFGVFSQSIRVTSAPLLVGSRPRLNTREFAVGLLLIAVPVAIVTIPLAGPLADLIAPGLTNAGRNVTVEALPVLGGAMVLQLWAAGGATVLAIRDRFDRIALAYISGALAGLVVYIAVSGSAGELSLGWSMLAMAIVTSAVMLDGVRAGREERPPAPALPRSLRAIARPVGLILGSTMIYLAFNGLFVVTLAFAGKYDPGDATVLSYAYLFASYLVAATGFALGMSRIADMRRGALVDWREVIADTVPAGFRYSMMLAAPALGVLISGGATLIGEVLPKSFDAAKVDQLQVFAALLCLWTVAALLVNLLLPAMFALGRSRLVNWMAPVVFVAHVAVTALGGILFGADGVVGAAFVVPAAFAALLLIVGAGRGAGPIARDLARDGLRFALLAAVSYGIGYLVGAELADGILSSLVTLTVGSVLYLLTATRFAPDQARLLIGAIKPASKPASA
ncbi:MAG TPA: hypothetical protein VH299_10550 [Solirubrobacterales bacterium]|jgi:hypothetical protein|nr:hypothetical protein [Solirubrobacterales bacterium]